MNRSFLIAVLLALVAGWADAVRAADPAQECPAWQEVIRRLEREEASDFNWPRRPMWKYLSRYLQVQWEKAQTPEERQRMLASWSHVGDGARFDPQLVEREVRLAVARRCGSVEWRATVADRFRLCVLALPGQVVLFGYPSRDSPRPDALYFTHLNELSRGRAGGLLEGRAYDHLQEEIRRMGPERWAFILMRLHPGGEPEGDEIPRIRLEGETVRVDLGAQRLAVELPDDEALAASIGRTFNPAEIPPPGNRRVYLAIDWSQFLAHPARRAWLAAELQAALASLPPHWLVDESVYLDNAHERVAWPLDDLRAGNWPPSLPTPHTRATLDALHHALQTADRLPGHPRLVFVSWNSGLTVAPDAVADAEATDPAARRLALRIVQVHGERVRRLEQIAGRKNYDIVEYRPEGPPALELFER